MMERKQRTDDNDQTLADKREALRQAMKRATVRVYAPEYYEREDS